MLWAAAVLSVVIVLAIAGLLVVREGRHMAAVAPSPLFDLEEAYVWVVDNVPELVAATLTPEDVRRILNFQLEFFKRKGVAVNGSTAHPPGPVVVERTETVDYIMGRAAQDGEAYIPEQIHAVVETQMRYLRAIGAVGERASDFEDDPSNDEAPSQEAK